MNHFSTISYKKFEMRTIHWYFRVGILGNTLDFSIFSVLSSTIGMPQMFANTISYTLSGIINFSVQRKWTFAGKKHYPL